MTTWGDAWKLSDKNLSYFRRCLQCNEPMQSYRNGTMLCKTCAAKLGVEIRQNKPQRDFPADWTLDVKNAKARELGLSYGKFVALVHDGVINVNELEKPVQLRTDPRRVVRHRI